MTKFCSAVLVLSLALMLGCGGEKEVQAPVAQPGTEVPTQTTTQVVPVDAAPPATPAS